MIKMPKTPAPGVGAPMLKNVGAPELKDVGAPNIPMPGIDKEKMVDVEKLKEDAERRRVEMINGHIQRLQDQINSKEPGDPSIAILEKIIESMKEKLHSDNILKYEEGEEKDLDE